MPQRLFCLWLRHCLTSDVPPRSSFTNQVSNTKSHEALLRLKDKGKPAAAAALGRHSGLPALNSETGNQSPKQAISQPAIVEKGLEVMKGMSFKFG